MYIMPIIYHLLMSEIDSNSLRRTYFGLEAKMPRRKNRWTRADGELLKRILEELDLIVDDVHSESTTPRPKKKWRASRSAIYSWLLAEHAPDWNELATFLKDSGYDELAGVCQSGETLRDHFFDRIQLNESLLSLFNQSEKVIPLILAPLPDLKDLITDPKISNRILKRIDIPTFLGCVKASRSHRFESGTKSNAVFPEIGCNHFLAPSAIFEIISPEYQQPRVLAYPRKPIPEEQRNLITGGKSILWNASYHFRESRAPVPMDDWVMGFEEGKAKEATELFLAGRPGRIPVFLKLLGYKLEGMNILKRTQRLHALPLGVVTNDLREEIRQGKKTNSVYTQFVLRVQLELKVEPTDSVLQSFIPSADRECRPFLLRHSTDPLREFVDSKTDSKTMEVNAMDVVAWRGLCGNLSMESHLTATFTRGFYIA